jgi:hypothetical protein
MEEHDQSDSNGNRSNNIAKFSGMAFQMIAVIGIFSYVGIKRDEAANHNTKWVTAILALTGVFISLYIVIKSLKN